MLVLRLNNAPPELSRAVKLTENALRADWAFAGIRGLVPTNAHAPNEANLRPAFRAIVTSPITALDWIQPPFGERNDTRFATGIAGRQSTVTRLLITNFCFASAVSPKHKSRATVLPC